MTVGVVGKNLPVLYRLHLYSEGHIGAVELGLGLGAALEIGNHGELGEVTVGVEIVDRGAETCERVIETFAEAAVAEGGAVVGVHQLGVGVDAEP